MDTDLSAWQRYLTHNQNPALVSAAWHDLAPLIGVGEEISYIAAQRKPGVLPPPLSVVLTTQRVILHKMAAPPDPPLIKPHYWREFADIAVVDTQFGSEIHLQLLDGQRIEIEAIPTEQANQIRRIIQEREAAARALHPAVPPPASAPPPAQTSRPAAQYQQHQIEYDNKSQYDRIAGLIVQGEILYAVFDEKGRGTGFVGITDRRLIFMDQGYIRKKTTLVSLPYSQITAVASEDTGGFVFGTSQLIVIAGSREWDFEFRSNEKAHRAYSLIMWNLLQNERGGLMRGAQV
jgi:hypothetical protein